LELRPHMKPDRIMFLAEDDIDDQDMLVEMIREQDPSMEFEIATSGSKALEALKKMAAEDKLPCLVLLDYNLPEISGAEILEKLRDMKQYEKIIKVVWSTSNSPVYQKKCFEAGVYSYIVKPTGIAGIRDIAKELLELCAKEIV
jgi:CheY-like chemotaxis protein